MSDALPRIFPDVECRRCGEPLEADEDRICAKCAWGDRLNRKANDG